MPVVNLIDRVVEGAKPAAQRYDLFDQKLKGFGLRVGARGEKTWFVMYRPNGGGRAAPKQRHTMGTYPTISVAEARKAARDHLASVQKGEDPAAAKARRRGAPTVAQLADLFMRHVDSKRKPRTAAHYADILTRIVLPALGDLKVDAVGRTELARLHRQWGDTPYQANRMLSVVSSMYSFGARQEIVAAGNNPTKYVDRFVEEGRGRLLEPEELQRLGKALREAETIGIKWTIDPAKPGAKHLGKNAAERRTTISREVAAALRLLIFTGARLREILHLRWSEVKLESGLLLLPQSKTGKKVIALNSAAIEVLEGLPRMSEYVIPGALKVDEDGNRVERPRSDLKRPWSVVSRRAGLSDLRLHDLRHSFASIALADGAELLVVSKLLGHANLRTTEMYAHLALKPQRATSNVIGSRIASAMGENR